MKLLLTSNGFIDSSLEKDFLEMVSGKTNLRVVVIPTASDPIEWVPEKEKSKVYVAKLLPEKEEENAKRLLSYTEKWKKKGYGVVTADLKENSVELKQKIESADIIDVTGGDVNYLLDWAKKSKLGTYLKKVLERGVVYVGTSAGSMLVTPNIGLTWWEPGSDLDRVGLGIVDFLVAPHQKENDEKSVENLTKRKEHLQSLISFPWTVYLLQDGQAVMVDGDKIQQIGEGTKKSI